MKNTSLTHILSDLDVKYLIDKEIEYNNCKLKMQKIQKDIEEVRNKVKFPCKSSKSSQNNGYDVSNFKSEDYMVNEENNTNTETDDNLKDGDGRVIDFYTFYTKYKVIVVYDILQDFRGTANALDLSVSTVKGFVNKRQQIMMSIINEKGYQTREGKKRPNGYKTRMKCPTEVKQENYFDITEEEY